MRVGLGRLTRLMKKYTVSHTVTAAPAAAGLKVNRSGSLLKLGLDIHREKFVVAAQYDHAMPRPPRRFAPAEFLPWVEQALKLRSHPRTLKLAQLADAEKVSGDHAGSRMMKVVEVLVK